MYVFFNKNGVCPFPTLSRDLRRQSGCGRGHEGAKNYQRRAQLGLTDVEMTHASLDGQLAKSEKLIHSHISPASASPPGEWTSRTPWHAGSSAGTPRVFDWRGPSDGWVPPPGTTHASALDKPGQTQITSSRSVSATPESSELTPAPLLL